MSQNESKAGSWSNSTAARHLILKLSDLELCSPPYPKPSRKIAIPEELRLIPRSEWANYLNRSSKHDALDAACFGLLWWTDEMSMKSILESLRTPADAVAAFRSINGRIAFYKDNEEGVSTALLPFCQMLLDGGIVELLSSVPKLPKDILSITTRFLVTSLHVSSQARVPLIECLLRKIMLIPLLKNSITNGSIRLFTWQESNQKKRTKNMPAEANPVKSWTAQSVVRTQEVIEGTLKRHLKMGESVALDGTGGLITISQFKIPSAGNLESFAWEISSSETGVRGRIYGYGFAETLEQAAEDAYLAFYKAVTTLAFESACQYAVDKEIVLLGKELTSEEFIKGAGKAKSYYFLAQMPQVDDRDGTLFCLNWHTIDKTKRTFKITKVSGKKLTLEGGTVLDVDTVLCYVRQPESHVNTEVLCSKCGQLNFPSTVGGRFIQGVGYQCGPCRDNSVELSELSDGQFDE